MHYSTPSLSSTPSRAVHFLIWQVAIAFNFYAASAISAESPSAPKNVLVIIADDFGIDSWRLFNPNPLASQPPTPTLNRLAQQGVVFRRAYAYPSCTPTRSTLLTGRYGFRTGLGFAITDPTNDPLLLEREQTLPELIKNLGTLGFRDGSVGKWHLSFEAPDPNHLGGWSHYSGELAAALQDYYLWPKITNGVETPDHNVYATTDNVNDAIDFIQLNTDQPWFLWLAFNAPHTPYHLPPTDLHSYDNLTGTQVNILANLRSYYEALVETMDTEIDRLLQNVDLNETVLVFFGDNGTAAQVVQPPFPPNHAKGSLYEGGIRIPFVIAGAGVVDPGRNSNALVHTVDLFSTILEWTGVPLNEVPPESRQDGYSLRSILANEAQDTPREALLSENFGPPIPPALAGRAIVERQYKLIQFYQGGEELYDLASDPLEQSNLLDSLPLDTATQDALLRLKNHSHKWRLPVRIDSLQTSETSTTLTLQPNPGLSYQLTHTQTLPAQEWVATPNANISPLRQFIEIQDPSPQSSQRFYQIHEPLNYGIVE